jgi:hypothetical protein
MRRLPAFLVLAARCGNLGPISASDRLPTARGLLAGGLAAGFEGLAAMSIESSDSATGSAAATLGEPSLPAATDLADDVADLASSIDRVAALIGATAMAPGDAIADALERIGDIAFVLHERDVEASLCDALDAAVREIGECEALGEASVQRSRQAAELLRELSRRVNAIAGRLRAEQLPVGPRTLGKASAAETAAPAPAPPAAVGKAKAAASALPQANPAAPARSAIGLRASDPFGPLRELSEEETIALFS